ncbi:hypothetical protein RRG08_048446 [Elysia crispata]|uniref:Uncharacterized protein n=1 Tax=Elysia crispata TaxID=231223 RepID=A0AAE1B9F5_9GAST|nr:hypothetical protein RRG08_048446 [Elysia crispata]
MGVHSVTPLTQFSGVNKCSLGSSVRTQPDRLTRRTSAAASTSSERDICRYKEMGGGSRCGTEWGGKREWGEICDVLTIFRGKKSRMTRTVT